jgi:hypothetical protein
MSVFYKVAALIASILVLFAAYLGFGMMTDSGSLSFIEPSQADKLSATAFQLNRSAPRNIDDDTRFEGVAVVPGGLQYSFTLLKLASSEVDVKEFRDIVYEGSKSATCRNPQLLNLLQSDNVFVEAVYHGNDGQFVTSFRIDGKTCESGA